MRKLGFSSTESNTIDVPFNWDDCLLNLSLNGLQNCSFFQQEIGTLDLLGNPTNTVDPIKMNNFTQYLNY